MRKTEKLELGLVIAVATFMMGCDRPDQTRRCVDVDGVVVSDDKCNQNQGWGDPTPQPNNNNRAGGGFYPYAYHYMYGGNVNSFANNGGSTVSRLSGGSMTAPSASVSRGFFGGTSRGFSVGS